MLSPSTLTIDAMRDLAVSNKYVRYISVFQNWLRPAGASFDHLHKQLVAIDDWNRTKRERVALATQLSIDAARDPELLDLAARAGIKQVFIGIETPNHAALREAKKLQNVRADLIADIRMFQVRGIAVQAGIIVGFDADTRDSFAVQFEFLQRAGVPSVLVNMLSAPEGTPLERPARSSGSSPATASSDSDLIVNLKNN